jgi:coniferyl-aldehyde dehydrogenase
MYSSLRVPQRANARALRPLSCPDDLFGTRHGEAGFVRLTQQKPVLLQSKWALGDLFYSPYGQRFERVLGLVKRLI